MKHCKKQVPTFLRGIFVAAMWVVVVERPIRAEKPQPPADVSKPAAETSKPLAVVAKPAADSVPMTRDALERGLRLLERAARNYPRHRDCFACHHQSFPLMAQVEGRRIGLRPDEPTRRAIAGFTREWFSQRQTDLRAGRSIDGRAITAAYGLWTLEMAPAVKITDVPPEVPPQVPPQEPPQVPASDPVVQALAEYLMKVQRADGAWEPEAHRPPAEESKAFVTALALRGLRWSASSPTGPQSVAADRAFNWLSSNAASAIADESIDELAGQLLAYVWRPDRFPDAKAAMRRSRIKEWQDRILFLQRENGGWSQRRGMASDPYATGLALWTLIESGFDHNAKSCQDAAAFLRIRQAGDGSWHTRSRCEPFQPYFDNGDPYGRDQFLSLMATGWSIAALARLEESRP